MTRNTLAVLFAAILVPALSACTSTATPKTAALYAPKVVVTGAQPVSTTAPVIANSGTYPTFGPPITAANKQMDDVQASQLRNQMAALTLVRQKGLVSEAQYIKQRDELRAIATNHGIDMQAQIGN